MERTLRVSCVHAQCTSQISYWKQHHFGPDNLTTHTYTKTEKLIQSILPRLKVKTPNSSILWLRNVAHPHNFTKVHNLCTYTVALVRTSLTVAHRGVYSTSREAVAPSDGPRSAEEGGQTSAAGGHCVPCGVAREKEMHVFALCCHVHNKLF